MILKLKTNSAEQDKLALMQYLSKHSIASYPIEALNVIVLPKAQNADGLHVFSCIEKIIPITTPYKFASKAYKNKTIINVNGTYIGNPMFNTMAGPCSVENEDQIFSTAEFLSKQGIKFIRGGAYKPRTSPYSFRGLEKKGLQLLRSAADQYNLNVVTEVLDTTLIDEVVEYADIVQVGSRNMHNFHLLAALGKINKPIILKRGFQAKAVEWLLAAEYILSGGNEQVILCERGIRSFDPSSRNVLDLGVVPLMKELSHLPVIIDPSHGTGASTRVIPAALAAAAIGADGILVEVHPNPTQALSDSEQALSFNQFSELLIKLQPLLAALGMRPENKSSILKSETLL